jgi:hypothetical protein
VSTSAANIIRAALGKLGVVSPGEAVRAGDLETGLAALNTILDAWKLERLYAYATRTIEHTVAGEAQSLTIGPLGDIDEPVRPERFEQGCYYSAGGLDYRLMPLTEAEYNAIGMKDVGALGPLWFEYTPSLPLGVLRFFPRIIAGAQLRLIVQQRIDAFDDASTLYTLPAGYERALLFTLAEEIAADYEREIPPTVARNAVNARRMLKRGNHIVPQLDMGETERLTDRARFLRG